MSLDKNRYEAQRWLSTAGDDLNAAEILFNGGKFSHVCFLSQQCGEKALKAIWFFLDEDPWGHSIQKLIEEIPEEQTKQNLFTLKTEGAMLDRHYIPARYPNGLPDLTPGECYFKSDAEKCMDAARKILDRARAILGE